MKEAFAHRLGIAAIVKNEEPYIEEWVRYHHLIGVDRFYIFDNGSTDRTLAILRCLADEYSLELIDFPGAKQQIPAYNYAIRYFKEECKYLAFIDADEFIVFRGDDLFGFVDNIIQSGKRIGGLAVNWRMFGSSGHETKPDGLVIENYLYHANPGGPGNDCVKNIVNPRAVYRYNHPHYPTYYPFLHSVDENGRIVKEWRNEIGETGKIQINHYFTKSKEEWIQRRSLGKADTGGMRTLEEFYQHDNNDIYDDSMLRYAEAIKREMKHDTETSGETD